MALITCPDCKAQVSTDASKCPHCGARTKPKSKVWMWVLGAPLALFVFFAIVGSNSPDADAKRQARAVIDVCMSDMKDPLKPAQTREAARWMCERLRDDFVRKYGVQP
ncbi:zinc ribbon domain-containing protein [Paucibacter sp. Y2R2-4]|uniref:zinc ribbon domain-containing protein n=1 Tax=Paucibacter sp. Y2R2-4 TaxID=2893553 RepID=UPI0021E4284F|nr:zinc ribbon domain-containing protein [Paucibacter sp. Y2R2-4]MCV2349299.1 hypothetical protein [Paucibacter sp. Y2R2-4]